MLDVTGIPAIDEFPRACRQKKIQINMKKRGMGSRRLSLASRDCLAGFALKAEDFRSGIVRTDVPLRNHSGYTDGTMAPAGNVSRGGVAPSADNKRRPPSRKSPRAREIAILRVLTATMTFHGLTGRFLEQVEVSVPSRNLRRLRLASPSIDSNVLFSQAWNLKVNRFVWLDR